MRIGLIADTHIPESRPQLWPQVFEAFDGVDAILHAGDVHDFFLVDQLAEVAPLWVARGDGEDGSGGRPVQPEHPLVRYTWRVELGGVDIGLHHDLPMPPRPPDYTVARWVERHFDGRAPDLIVYGDTHVEAIEVHDGILCVNPGSPTYPHQLNTQLGTIGFLDIEDGVATPSIWRLTEGGIEPFDWGTWPRPW